MLFDRKQSQPKRTPAEMSRNLREKALSVTAADLNLAPIEARPHVWGVLMEIGYEEAVATVAVFADGSVSLYISSGGGVIGAGEHPMVREAAERLLTITEKYVPEFESASQTPLPQTGRVRFYVRTFTATLTADADEKDLGNHRHKLSAIFHAGQGDITEMRLTSETRKGGIQ
ncbi:MAG TPA: hypothetical protein VK527_10145 [Candidatus Limnocylindrales bacterium]|nr:hypothetical protein [Candidatus Limnocylindrales bacterium]